MSCILEFGSLAKLDRTFQLLDNFNADHVECHGLNGFEELRRYIKQGNEFCREVASVMQERALVPCHVMIQGNEVARKKFLENQEIRAELESTYAKSLTKLGNKLSKAATGCLGTLASAWSMAATEMEAEAELHRALAQALLEDIYKPMKNLAETQHKTRKPIDSMVDKSVKSYSDKRNEEIKNKKNAFNTAKERERLCEQVAVSKSGRGKTVTDKDITKMEKSLRKLEDGMRKADKEYHEACQRAESSRQEWETAVYKGSSGLQTLEEDRINQMQDLLNKYNSHMSVIGPKLLKSCERLSEAVVSVDTNADLRTVVDQKGTGPNQPEQYLVEYYAEDMTNQMDRHRRRTALQNYVLYIHQDIERELKGKEGVEKLVEVYQNRPNFADAEAQEDARQKLAHVNAMLNFLEASHYKISCSIANLEGRSTPASKFAQYIEKNKDKQGLTVSILRLPLSMVMDGYSGPDPGATYRAPADGGQADAHFGDGGSQVYGAAVGTFQGSVRRDNPGRRVSLQRLSSEHKGSAPTAPGPPLRSELFSCYDDENEFDDYDPSSPTIMCQCRAKYDYTACQYDELSIRPGDIINVYDKQEDGWWQGELGGRVGMFPATYVEEFSGSS